MMSDMIAYTTELLQSIAIFLGTAPMIYLFGCIVACFVVKIIKTLVSI